MNQTQIKYFTKRIQDARDVKLRKIVDQSYKINSLSQTEIADRLKSVGLAPVKDGWSGLGVEAIEDARLRQEAKQRVTATRELILDTANSLLDRLHMSGDDELLKVLEDGLKQLNEIE